MTRGARSPWWRGARGEWYVAAQVALFSVVLFGPRTLPGLPVWSAQAAGISMVAGAALMIAGGCLLLASVLRLGANLTPLPYPRDKAVLVQTGPYGIVRHPIYASGVLLAYGWAVAARSWLTLAYATAVLIFFEIKATREEQWLLERYPEYREYRRRVRKLIPYVH